jgi:regulator of sigma E protease
MIVTILSFIVVIGIVIFMHELGHFLAAKSVGIRVERFSIGYPPRMVGRKIGETDYCVSWLPLGGYVKMAGMIDESLEVPEKITGAKDEFMSKNAWQKTLVITAGVIMNMVLAAGIYSVVTMAEGVPIVKDPIVQNVSPGLPAESAGIVTGDRITGINGSAIATWDELVSIIYASADKPLTIAWQHEGESRVAEVVPKRGKTLIDGKIEEVGQIGISARFSFRPAGFIEALGTGVRLTVNNIRLGVTSIGMLVTGRASVKDLGGPIAIAKWSGESARGGLTSLVLFIAFISINIGLINILPVPVLDGGHLAMIVIEAVTRRPISIKIKLVVQQVGMVLLLALMAVIIFNDMGRVGLLTKIKGIF